MSLAKGPSDAGPNACVSARWPLYAGANVDPWWEPAVFVREPDLPGPRTQSLDRLWREGGGSVVQVFGV